MAGKRNSWAAFHVLCLSLQLLASALLLALGGCSTAPIANLLDLCSPGRFPDKAKDMRGGVCIPQGGPPGGINVAPPPPGAVVVPGDLPPPVPPGLPR